MNIDFAGVTAPFKLSPVFKNYLWGGDRLKRLYNKKSELDIIAESWELSAHLDGDCAIAESPDSSLAGKLFSEVAGADFPLLVKLIDAKSDLSIQVHPDDAFARAHENANGKAELWYVLDADKGASVYIGLNRDMTAKELANGFSDGSIVDALNKVRVKRGDAFFIAPGTIHAINGGVTLAEIQQSSNITYRAYDYGRLGNDGRPRELHIEKAVAAAVKRTHTDFALPHIMSLETDGLTEVSLIKCDYFNVNHVLLDGGYGFPDGSGFCYLMVLNGKIDVLSHNGVVHANKGEGVFVPDKSEKAAPQVTGTAEMLVVYC